MERIVQIKSWVKILAVTLIVYSFIAGLLIPLGPGIINSFPAKGNAGEQISLDINTYNTHFLSSVPKVYLKSDNDQVLGAQNISVSGNTKLTADFSFPSITPGSGGMQGLTLIISNERDGFTLLPDALFLMSKQSGSSEAWVDLSAIEFQKAKRVKFPFRNILAETIRNIYYHVSLWFAMILMFFISMIRGLQYLRSGDMRFDEESRSYVEVGTLFGLLGLVTGRLWANYTWGKFWSFDVKQNMSAVALLIYCAYFVLRSSIEDLDKQARISAAYNIFSFVALIPLIFVVPRLTDSLHPGNGGNPALGSDDLDNTMRLVFYPAVIGWMLLGIWMSNIIYRYHRLKRISQEKY